MSKTGIIIFVQERIQFWTKTKKREGKMAEQNMEQTKTVENIFFFCFEKEIIIKIIKRTNEQDNK